MFDKLRESWYESRAIAEREDKGLIAQIAMTGLYRVGYESLHGRDNLTSRDITTAVPDWEIAKEPELVHIPERNEND